MRVLLLRGRRLLDTPWLDVLESGGGGGFWQQEPASHGTRYPLAPRVSYRQEGIVDLDLHPRAACVISAPSKPTREPVVLIVLDDDELANVLIMGEDERATARLWGLTAAHCVKGMAIVVESAQMILSLTHAVPSRSRVLS